MWLPCATPGLTSHTRAVPGVQCAPQPPLRRHPPLIRTHQQQQQQQRCGARVWCAASGGQFGGTERVLDLADLLNGCDDLDAALEDDADELPVWEHEHRVKALPFTEEELREREVFLAKQKQARQQQQPLSPDSQELLPDPLQAVQAVMSAYTAEQGFREMSVQELSVALAAGGLVDLLLDVRSREEFDAGPSIPTAVNVPITELSDVVRSGSLDPYMSGSIAVVCASGQRSAQATVRLSKVFGFGDVKNVTGGMAAWQQLQSGLRSSSSGGGCGCGGSGGGNCHQN